MLVEYILGHVALWVRSAVAPVGCGILARFVCLGRSKVRLHLLLDLLVMRVCLGSFWVVLGHACSLAALYGSLLLLHLYILLDQPLLHTARLGMYSTLCMSNMVLLLLLLLI